MNSPPSEAPTLEYVMASPALTVNSSRGAGPSHYNIGDTPQVLMSSPEMVRSSGRRTIASSRGRSAQSIASSRDRSVQSIASSRPSVQRHLFSP